MRIAVYAIAKNEYANVEGWAESAADADDVVLVDTGSDDTTWSKAAANRHITDQHRISITPWRFDDARNAALALVPRDVDFCVSLDLDERLQPGWRLALEDALAQGVTRPLYRYVWSWQPDGSEGVVFDRDHAHQRIGYRWKHPVHETVGPVSGQEHRRHVDGMVVHQHGDPTKDRPYLPLLELAVAEDPQDDRNSHYLGREYLFQGRWDKAEDELKRHLSLPKAIWDAERAASMRYLARVVQLRRGETARGQAEVEGWLLRACAEAPGYREPWMDLARHYLATGRISLGRSTAARALEITERSLDYLSQSECWDGTLEKLTRWVPVVPDPGTGD